MELNIMSDSTIGTLLIIGSVFFDVLANICLKNLKDLNINYMDFWQSV